MANNRRLAVISYADEIRTTSLINHAVYCSIQNISYHFDIAPTKTKGYFSKIELIDKYLNLYDWVFWLDDDAFFTQLETPLDKFIHGNAEEDFIFCRSPINSGQWTYLSAGNFFAHNTPKTHQVLKSVLETNLDEVKEWWNPESYGLFTNGDQDALVYQLIAGLHDAKYKLLPFSEFNTRPFHFKNNHTEHFLVHFTGDEKHRQSLEFARRFNLTDELLPKSMPHCFSSKFVDAFKARKGGNKGIGMKLHEIGKYLFK